MQEPTSENDEDIFEFDCPDCGAHIVGEVSRCPECGVEFVIEEVTEEAAEDDADDREADEVESADDEADVEAEEAANPDDLKAEFSSLVDELRPMLEMAERHGADTSAPRRLIDKAVSSGKRREVESAVVTLRECRSELNRAIVDRLEQDLCHLEDLAELAERAGSDAASLRTLISGARAMMEGGDAEGALREAESGERMAEKLSGRYTEANGVYEALERAVLNSERFYLDVREVRKLLNEAREAKERADWTTMGILAKKGRDELGRVLPDVLNAELRRAKQSLLDAKSAGRDVSSMVKLLRAAGVAAKRGRHEESLERLVEFQDEEAAS